MSRNGSGVQTSPAADYPAVADTLITATHFNNVIDDINTGITGSIAADGQTTITANLPMNSKKFTGLASGSARTDSINLGQVQDGTPNWVDGGGTADAITATYSPAITTLVDGQICFVRATAANATTTPTFAPNGLTARTIVKKGGKALVAGDIEADGHELILRYLLASTRWELMNPASGAFAENVTAGDGTTGARFVKADGLGSGSAGGSYLASAVGGVTRIAIGNYSAIIGGAYDASPLLYAADAVQINQTFKPSANNTHSLGTAALQWSDVRAVLGTFSGAVSGTTITGSAGITSTSPTAGIGYATGAGGTVTQGTSNTTAVTLNKICGNITTFGGQYNTDSVTIFTLNNSAITGSGSCVVAASFNGDASSGRFSVQINPTGTGVASVAIRNHSASNITETLLINFAVIPKVNS